jgi:hypothetical protein
MIGPADLHPPATQFRTFHIFEIYVYSRIINSVLLTWSRHIAEQVINQEFPAKL